MIKTYNLLTLEQPIGFFGITVMPVEEILKIAYVNRRSDDPVRGKQRKLIPDRVKSISKFIDETPFKVAFPTPIILSLTDSSYEDSTALNPYSIISNSNGFSELQIDDVSEPFCEVIDGQHRLAGIECSSSYKSQKLQLSLPVLFVINATDPIGAYLFSIINGNQKPVPYSLIADLFALQEERSITKVAHNIVADLNTLDISPFKNSIKMLGFKTNDLETLSQGTIVRVLEKLIETNYAFRQMYNENSESVISKILINMFLAIRSVWKTDWYESRSVIKKTVAFHGFMRAFPSLFEIGSNNKDLSKQFFIDIFMKTKSSMENDSTLIINDSIYFSSVNFPSSLQGAKKLSDIILLDTKIN